LPLRGYFTETGSVAAMSAEKGKSEVINLKWDNAAGEVLDVYRSLVG